jgi:hypothetical protein
MPPFHFLAFIAVSLIVFLAILNWVLRSRPVQPDRSRVAGVSFVVVVVGMCFAKFGANLGLHWALYYGLPALITVTLPPIALRMQRRETVAYIALAFASSPAIHAFFSFFVGWHEYMPFWHIPSLWNSVHAGA